MIVDYMVEETCVKHVLDVPGFWCWQPGKM